MFEKVRDIIAEELEITDLDEITVESHLMDELDADSLDAVEIVMALEDEFDISIPDEDAQDFETISQIMEYIQERL